ncbi:hypothetical protein G3A39_41010 [Paraburkholderia aspalathi]|nr:hypothetical protein [Paraburkholderia aspalathi]
MSLHDYMSVDAMYFMEGTPEDAIRITVRVHEKWVALGDMKGTNFNYAETESIAPRIIFMLSEISPDRGAIVSVEPGVAFRVDTPLPPDDISVTATVIKLTESETVGFPLPGDAP